MMQLAVGREGLVGGIPYWTVKARHIINGYLLESRD
jgi:hypothetical protein